ncbi:MAG: ParA family protein [Solirubrobacterales bacterium]
MASRRVPGPPVVAVFNHKGGVAKTTSACNLAVCLGAYGLRVLLIDLDAQGNATGSFGILPLPPAGAYDLITGRAGLDEVMLPTPFPNLRLLPATVALRTADLELAAHERGHAQLRDNLDGRQLAEHADICIIDCPPALGTITANALSAAAAVLIPAKPDPFAHEGLVNTWYEIKRLRERDNADLAVAGILLTMGGTDPASEDVARTIRAEFGDQVYAMEIPHDPKVAEAAQLAVPVAVLDPDGAAGSGYMTATGEVLRRLTARGISLPATVGRGEALNTLRDWRAAQPRLRHLGQGGSGWTAVAKANAPVAQDSAAHDWRPPEPAETEPGHTRLIAAGAFVAGLLVGLASRLVF